jgi:ABC-type multidrug transport system fused ATPase/permease subunit
VIGGWRVQQSAVTAGELVQAALLFSILAFPMRVFGFFLQELPRAVTSIDRIDAVAQAPEVAPHRSDHPAELPEGPLGIELRDVSFAYDGEPVLDRMSFSVEPGETVAIVGSTGSGKSTMAMLMIRLVDPDAGSIRVGGVDISHVEEDELRSAISLVFQESFLFAESVRDNIGLGVADAAHVEEVARLARVARFLPELDRGWETVVGERGVTLSGGQRQRVALARALARRPRILILDDATSAVDPTIEAEILGGLRGGLRMTLLVVAHRLSTIRLADRVVYVEDGRAAAVGRHDDLVARVPGYQALVRAYEQEAAT